jgi:hypothetical protein
VNEILWTISNSANTGSKLFKQYLIELKWHNKLLDNFFIAENDRIRMVIVDGLNEICSSNIECLDDGFKNRIQELIAYESESEALKLKIDAMAQYFIEHNDN